MNKVFLIGNLAADPEVRNLSSGSKAATIRLAVQRSRANQDGIREADFLTVVTWNKSAEYAEKYLHKGSKLAVDGSIQVRSYDARDGSKRYVTEIIADRIEGLNSRSDGESNASSNPQPHNSNEGFTEIADDQLPF